jgi:hypothetical protein
LRGLFGISVDAQTKTITVNPHLPAGWKHAEVIGLPEGARLQFDRNEGALEVRFSPKGDDVWKLRSDMPGAHLGGIKLADWEKAAKVPGDRGLSIPLAPVEVDGYATPYGDGGIDSATWPLKKALPGERTLNIRVLRKEDAERRLTLTFEGPAGSDGIASLFRNARVEPQVNLVDGRKRNLDTPEASVSYRSCDANPYECKTLPLVVHFPPGEGWKTITVTLTW